MEKLVLSIFAFGAAGVLFAQGLEGIRRPFVEQTSLFRVAVEEVIIPVAVIEPSGTLVPHLQRHQFRLYEDRIEQKITHFGESDFPFSVALLLDTSQSTVPFLSQIQEATVEFITLLRPDDELMVLSFDDQVRVESEFCQDKQEALQAVQNLRTGASTSLYHAVCTGLAWMSHASQVRKAMVIFSDGIDWSRFSSREESFGAAESSDVVIYPIYFSAAPPQAGPRFHPAESERVASLKRYSQQAQAYLQRLAQITGGTFHVASSPQQLQKAFREIASQLRVLYSLGYAPLRRDPPGGYRHITVEVDVPGVRVRHRQGYHAGP